MHEVGLLEQRPRRVAIRVWCCRVSCHVQRSATALAHSTGITQCVNVCQTKERKCALAARCLVHAGFVIRERKKQFTQIKAVSKVLLPSIRKSELATTVYGFIVYTLYQGPPP